MTKVYVDTNVFLDFYQSTNDPLKVFETIVNRSADIVLPEQTVNEFKRNRVSRLADLAAKVEGSGSKMSIHTTSVIRELKEFKDWDKAKDSAKEAASRIVATLTEWIEDPKKDGVFDKFQTLFGQSLMLNTTPEAIQRAHTRKLIGSPPTSPDKFTIGDELIWETLLAGVNEDLVIVSRDKTFLENHALLRDEFEKAGSRRLLLVTGKLSDALARVGKPEPVVVKAEEEILKADAYAIHTGVCPVCDEELVETGYDGSDGDSAW